MKLILSSFQKLLKGKLSKFGKLKLLIRCTRPKSIALFIVGSWLLFGAICLSFALLDKLEKVGQFGDFFGSLNTLFSGAALAGVIVSLMMQRKELHLQRREMQLTRKEMQDQRKVMDEQKTALQKQQKVWEKQNFDSLFFALFNTHNSIKESLTIKGTQENIDSKATQSYRGYEVFTSYKHRMNTFEMRNLYETSEELNNRRMRHTFNKFRFETYVKSLEQLYSIVNNASKDLINKDEYFTIINRTICKEEQLVLFFYGLDPSYDELRSHIIEHGLLNNIPTTYPPIFNHSPLIRKYPLQAYKISSFPPLEEQESDFDAKSPA